MARLSPKRRREAKVRAALSALAHANDDSAKLQRGAVKCALDRRTTYKMIVPRALSLEGEGRKKKAAPKHFTDDGYRHKVMAKLGV